jgi:hypothetical protein
MLRFFSEDCFEKWKRNVDARLVDVVCDHSLGSADVRTRTMKKFASL